MEGHEADGRVDHDFQDLLWRGGGDLLDLHAALGRGHDGDAAGGAVDQHAEIKLAGDVAAVFDIEALYFLARLAGLLGHQDVPEHLAGILLYVVQRLANPHPALSAGIVLETPGAAAAGVDLRFDHPDRAA